MSTLDNTQQRNRELAEQLLHEAQSDPQSRYAKKKIGIANGQVIVVADNWNEVARQLEQAEPDPAKTYCINTGVDYSEVQEIWEIV